MLRIKKIGNIELENVLLVIETFNIKNVKAVSFNTLDGNKIVYESIKRENANNITLDSKEGGWIKEDTLNKIILLGNNLGIETTLTTLEGAEIRARFKLEDSETIKAEAIFESSKWYKVVIKMARI